MLCLLQDVIRFSLQGDDTDSEFFYLNVDNGYISVKKNLLDTSISQFRVGFLFISVSSEIFSLKELSYISITTQEIVVSLLRSHCQQTSLLVEII